MSNASSRNSQTPKREPFPRWLADPFCCIAKAQEGTMEAHLTPCAVLTERNEASMRATRVIHTSECGVDVYSFGSLSATRDPRYGIQLTVNTSPNHSSSTPFLTGQEAQLASDVLRAAVANTGGRGCGGQSITEILEDELHSIIDRIMTGAESEDGRDPGRAEGVAYALAVFRNPYRPNIEEVRERAMDRWYDENPEAEGE